MERLDTDGALDLPLSAAGARVGRSRRKSAANSKSDPEKADTPKAGKRPKDFTVELSLLQSVYEQALVAGLLARATQQAVRIGESQLPELTIHLLNVSKCPDCGSWITGLKCPMC